MKLTDEDVGIFYDLLIKANDFELESMAEHCLSEINKRLTIQKRLLQNGLFRITYESD